MTRLEATRVIVGAGRRRGDCREPRPSRLRSLRRRRSPARISTPGAAWASPRRSASAWRWRGPTSRVFVLDGDGSLLMNLGSLATIGLLRPANLVARRDGQRGIRHDRRPEDADGARRRPRRRRAGDGRVARRRRCEPRSRTGGDRGARVATQRGRGRHHRQGERVGADREAAARLRRSSSSGSWPRSAIRSPPPRESTL